MKGLFRSIQNIQSVCHMQSMHRGTGWQFKKSDLSEIPKQLAGPARGWYQIYTFSGDREPDFKELEWCLDRDDSLALILVDIGTFRDRDLDDGCLARMGRILEFFAGEGYDIILRVSYDHEGKGMEREPSFFSQVLRHLEQIGVLLETFSDKIFIYQGMLVGNWGEMHTTRFLGEEQLEKMTDVLRSHRRNGTYLAVRQPRYWRMLHAYAHTQEEMPSDGMGLFDDGIFGSESNMGTFGTGDRKTAGWQEAWGRNEELDFEDDLCRFVPNGGEAVWQEEYTRALSQSMILETLRKMHITYLNKAHDTRILNLWKDRKFTGPGVWSGRSMYEYVGAHLGYRFRIRNVSVTPKRAQEDCCRVEIEIENTGFAAFYQEGEVYLEHKSTEEGFTAIRIPCDIRDWEAGGVRTIACVTKIGDGELFLSARRKRDGAPIFFANLSDEDGRVILGRIVCAATRG